MSKFCISDCANDATIPVRATYVNLYKWPGSDAEFVHSAALHGGARLHSRVVDSISCRQMYLRSYTFSTEETPTVKCFGMVREASDRRGRKKRKKKKKLRRRRRSAVRRMKEISRAAVRVVFRRLLLCSATVYVVHNP